MRFTRTLHRPTQAYAALNTSHLFDAQKSSEIKRTGQDCGSGLARSPRRGRPTAERCFAMASRCAPRSRKLHARGRGSRRAERPRGPHANGWRRGAHRWPFPPVATTSADSCFPPLLMRRAPGSARCKRGELLMRSRTIFAPLSKPAFSFLLCAASATRNAA